MSHTIVKLKNMCMWYGLIRVVTVHCIVKVNNVGYKPAKWSLQG